MPYVGCERCGLIAFSAAYLLGAEHCARCGAELPRPSRGRPPRAPFPYGTRRLASSDDDLEEGRGGP